MPQINLLSAVDSLAAGDQFPLYAVSQGDARKTSLTTLAEYLQGVLTSQVEM